MTEKQLRKLTRAELLELLIEQTKKTVALEKELEECKAALESRDIKIENAGSIAEAALQISGIFETAENAAEQYLENIKRMEEETAHRCEKLEEATKKICLEKIQEAEQQSNEYWKRVSEKLERFYETHPGLKDVVEEKVQQKRKDKNE